MGYHQPSRTVLAYLCIALILVFGAAVSNAQEMTEISGTISLVVTQQQPIEIGDAEGHEVNFMTSDGTNENKGEHDFMASAKVTNISYSDLVNGNGTHHGYVTLTTGDDSAIAKWKGTVTTTVTADTVSNTTFEGTYTYIHGTGKYVNINGGGTYKGSFSSETEYTAEWEGKYFIKK
jgi:hypothetical protein